MNIKEGEYIRDEEGNIGKITKIVTDDIFYVQFYDNLEWKTDFEEAKIKAHSKNIIDLIEVGDYVNGYKVELSRYNELYYAYVYCGGIDVRTTEAYATFIKDMKYEDIDSIVTKEQFKEMEYRINE